MKKILLALILISVMFLIGSTKIGAKMNDNYTQVRAQHILVESEQQANEIKQEIESNKTTFENAARKYSMCPSKAQGGDLGYFGRGMMVKEFEDAAFDGDVDKVSNPVKTHFGWHLVKVIDKK